MYQRFAFKIPGISCLALIFNLNNLRTIILFAEKLVTGCKIKKPLTIFL